MFNSIIGCLYNLLFTEEKCLEELCRFYIKGNRAKRKRLTYLLTRRNLNWQILLDLVRVNKLQTVVLESIEFYGLEVYIPANFQKQLVKLVFATKLYHTSHIKQTEKILRRLNKKKVNFVIMKAYALSGKVITNYAIKPPEDLDLLIPISDFKKANSILLESGYKYYPEHQSKTGLSFIPASDFYQPKGQEIFKKGIHSVELHTTIIDTFDFLPEPVINNEKNILITQELYKSARLISFNGVKAKVFPPTQLLINMCLHSFFQHNLQGGMAFYEWAELVLKCSDRIFWDYIFDFMERYTLKQYFLWFLILFNEFFPNLLPKKILAKVNSYKISFKLQHVLVFFFMKYKVFHPTNFLKTSERQKEWCWAMIRNSLKEVFLAKAKRRARAFIGK